MRTASSTFARYAAGLCREHGARALTITVIPRGEYVQVVGEMGTRKFWVRYPVVPVPRYWESQKLIILAEFEYVTALELDDVEGLEVSDADF